MHHADHLVLGSGIAGLSFALKAARHGKVVIITKGRASDGNTHLAQGGIACVSAPGDTEEEHVQDTLNAGAGHCNEEAVRLMVKEAPNCINELLDLGISFSRKEKSWDLHREAGHSRHRILHYFDMTGREIENTLLRAVSHHPNITLYQNHCALDLMTGRSEDGKAVRCLGAYVLNERETEIIDLTAAHTVICTGGAGQVYACTTNPAVTTGDGIAMALRAGARLADMEFIQFHPTALYTGQEQAPLITEALRGAGAELVNADGEPFMHKYHPAGALAPRDVIARAMVKEMQDSGHRCVYLSLDNCHVDLEREFPQVFAHCLQAGIQPGEEFIPVVPAMHYLCGGIATDLEGRTSIRGLYAFGEAACTGVHGANRLASNSLLEALVFSHQAFLSACRNRKIPSGTDAGTIQYLSNTGKEASVREVEAIRSEIKDIMGRHASIIRHTADLKNALQTIKDICIKAEVIYTTCRITLSTAEVRNMAQVATAILTAAARRSESCGLHYIGSAPGQPV